MVAMDTGAPRLTTLTYVHERGRAVFRGVVDATNLEIFRDFLLLLPTEGDVVISIADLEIRHADAASLLVDRARTIGGGGRLVLTVGDAAIPGPAR